MQRKTELAKSLQQVTAAKVESDALRESNASLMHELNRLKSELVLARHAAYYDQLTGLPNRSLFLNRLSQALSQAERHNKKVVIVFLDLDRFKAVNDNLGHAAGDQILREVASRLKACVRAADTACRYGGDEFVLMLPQFQRTESAQTVVAKIRKVLDAPYSVDDRVLTVSASIGTATYPEDGKRYKELIEHADTAMYCSKGGGVGSAGLSR